MDPSTYGELMSVKQSQADRDQSLLAAMVESVDDAIVSETLDGVITSWNKGAERILGYPVEEVIGKHISIIVPAEHDDPTRILDRNRGGERVDQCQTKWRTKDRRFLDVSLTVLPVRDGAGNVVGASTVARDITERKQCEERLRESEQRLAAELEGMIRLHELSTRLVQTGDAAELLLEIVDAAIAVTAADLGNIQLFDRGSGTLKIVANRGFEASFLEFFNSVHEGQAACGTAMSSGKRVIIEDVAASPVFAGTPALEVMLVAGARAVQSTPLTSRSGRLVGMLSTHYRTPRRPAERDLRLLDLLARQAADCIERMQAEEDLCVQAQRKDEFLAMLAHELRNPLSAISMAVKVARQSRESELLDWSIDVVERQVKQLAHLIDDLLDVSRIIRGKIQLRQELIDIVPILNSALSTIRPLIEERKHKLFVSFGLGTLRVKADPVRIEQVALNLLTNAAKYTESGGQIWLTAEQRGTDVVIQVRDTGIGIPPERLSEMFEPFVQGDRSLARSEGGLGIGLTLVKSLVEMHQGSISAMSEGPGTGTEFTVRLPGVLSSHVQGSDSVATSAEVTRSSRILVVDDNADCADGLARLLKLLGHDVSTANDGPEAIVVAETVRPEVVLLDIGLPGMDGYEVARQLRKSQTCKEALIAAVSGYGNEEDRRRSRDAGFDFHFVKPVDHDALLAVLNTS
jgi:PAS domain S-box-containing protein